MQNALVADQQRGKHKSLERSDHAECKSCRSAEGGKSSPLRGATMQSALVADQQRGEHKSLERSDHAECVAPRTGGENSRGA